MTMHQRRVVIVQNACTKIDSRSVEAQRLVHSRIRPSRATAMIETCDPFAGHRPIPAHRRAHERSAALEYSAGAARRENRRQLLSKLLDKLGRQPFIGIEREYP